MGLAVYVEDQIHTRTFAGSAMAHNMTMVVAKARRGSLLSGVHRHADTMFNVAQLPRIVTELMGIGAQYPELSTAIDEIRLLLDGIERNRGYLWIAGD
jgi:azurin